jgi:mRNA interferase RelE/StbE
LIYEILISKDVRKFLEKKDKKFLQKANLVFEKLKTNPFNHPALDIKKMVNSQNDYRIRIGKYRFLYSVIESKIIIYVYKADSRGSVYKK